MDGTDHLNQLKPIDSGLGVNKRVFFHHHHQATEAAPTCTFEASPSQHFLPTLHLPSPAARIVSASCCWHETDRSACSFDVPVTPSAVRISSWRKCGLLVSDRYCFDGGMLCFGHSRLELGDLDVSLGALWVVERRRHTVNGPDVHSSFQASGESADILTPKCFCKRDGGKRS